VTASRPDGLLDADGPAAPPRRNGELVFAAPWESRVFGVTLALHAAGAFAWEEFRRRLIAEVGAADRREADGASWSYWACWLAALEDLLAAKGLCAPSEVAARRATFAARPPGHDHRRSE
jgi:nitrile hydratase accessory protein